MFTPQMHNLDLRGPARRCAWSKHLSDAGLPLRLRTQKPPLSPLLRKLGCGSAWVVGPAAQQMASMHCGKGCRAVMLGCPAAPYPQSLVQQAQQEVEQRMEQEQEQQQERPMEGAQVVAAAEPEPFLPAL